MRHLELGEKERRTLELANRLQDMTEGEWSRLKRLIDGRFESKRRELEWQLQLSEIKDEDFAY